MTREEEQSVLDALSAFYRMAGLTSKDKCKCGNPNCLDNKALAQIPPPLPMPDNLIKVDFRRKMRTL